MLVGEELEEFNLGKTNSAEVVFVIGIGKNSLNLVRSGIGSEVVVGGRSEIGRGKVIDIIMGKKKISDCTADESGFMTSILKGCKDGEGRGRNSE